MVACAALSDTWAREGVRYLIIRLAEAQMPSGELTIIGGLETPLITHLRATSGPGVRWVGNVPFDQMLQYYQRADVFVFPTLFESFGLVVAEAMACGIPVITTPTAGSIVRDGVDGFIVPERDTEMLKRKLLLLSQDAALRMRMAENARARVVGSFTWYHYGERLASFYRDVVFR